VPRAAAAVAKTNVRLMKIEEKRFLFMVQQTPHFALQIMRVMADRLRTMDARR
jgi:CRP-like cAMP-binding protein